MHRLHTISAFLIAVLCLSIVSFPSAREHPSLQASVVDFDLLCANPVQIASPQALEIIFNIELVNVGDESDSYDIMKYDHLPSGSYSSFCFGGSCLRPDLDSLSSKLPLTPMMKDTISVHVSPGGVVGGGSVRVKVRSNANPGLERVIDLYSITQGTRVLVVDDDGEENYEQYYEKALGDEVTFGRWPLCCKQVTPVDLGFFDIVIWLTGEASPSLSANDRTALEAFLSTGGNLFLSGQNIGWSLCDPKGPDYSPAACEFYQNVLHAGYVANASGDLTLSGVNGDGVSHGLAIDLSGGDGADNQTSPSIISPIAPAKAVFTYDGSQAGAVWAAAGGSKVVYFAFGFEAINSEAMRRTIMLNLLDRFTYDGEKGDVNHDGSINVLDVLQGANFILTIAIPTPAQEWRADFDNNKTINVIDLIGMVNVILGGGAN